MIKLLFALIVMVSTVEAQTADLENQIKTLQTQLDSTRGDSTAGVINTTVQLDSTLAANNIKITNKSHQNGNFDPMWIAWDFSDSVFSADKALQKRFAISILKNTYKGQVNGDFVRVRKDRINAESIAAVANIIKD